LLPDLSVVTLTQQPVLLEARYSLLAEAGVGAGRAADGELAGHALIGLQAALLHGSAAALQQACRRCLPELKTTLRGMIQHHLGASTLRTRRAMLDVQSLSLTVTKPRAITENPSP
jgi:DNA repair protein RecO (recombination protein O)